MLQLKYSHSLVSNMNLNCKKQSVCLSTDIIITHIGIGNWKFINNVHVLLMSQVSMAYAYTITQK